MKTLLLAFIGFFLMAAQDLQAQEDEVYKNYEKFLKQGDEALEKDRFKEAIINYITAEGYVPDNKEIIREKINYALDKTESLRIKADSLRTKAERNERIAKSAFKEVDKSKEELALALGEAREAKKEVEIANVQLKEEKEKVQKAFEEVEEAEHQTQLALQKANKLIRAFYFYDGKFALAYDGQFYFIDEKGNRIKKINKYSNAVQFDQRGFARVRKNKRDMLIDTFGIEYPVVYDVDDLGPNIKALDLSDQGLSKVPAKVFKNTQLEVLLLDHNHLSELPKSFKNLSNLKYLNLSHNHWSYIPSLTGRLFNLKSLDISHNKIKKFSPELGKLRYLNSLNLSNNSIRELPPEIGDMYNLQFINLNYNQLKNLPEELVKLKDLNSLHLEDNNLAEIPSWFNRLEEIKSLNLHSNSLYKNPIPASALVNLQSLDLSDNQLKKLPKDIAKLKNLKVLKVLSNSFSEEEKERLKTQIPWCQIEFVKDENKVNYLEMGTEAMRREAYKEAVELFLKDLSENNNPRTYGYIGQCYISLKDNKKALQYLNEYHILKPYLPATVIQLRELHFELKNYPMAAVFAKKVTVLLPEKHYHWHRYSQLALFAGQAADAIRAAKQALKVNKYRRSIMVYLASAYVLDDQWERAEQVYLEWKGITLETTKGSHLFDELFYQNIQELEQVGIRHRDFPKVRALFPNQRN
ncbi:MAG: leucine-rich repeat domain-containing protein [Bacteroidota bacterium]